MKDLYIEVNSILESFSFNKLWKGFKKMPFALYNKEQVYFESETIPYDNRFIANTTILYNDEYIAIWYVENPKVEDPKLLAANLVHEMFHGYYMTLKDTRFPEDLLLLDYPDKMKNYQMKFYENQLLAKSFKSTDIEEKRSYLKEFFALRTEREKLIGNFIKNEYLLETSEGLAEYIGTKALREISMELYEERVNNYLNKISKVKKYFFDIRRISYYVGCIFYLALEAAEIDFYSPLGTTDKTYYELVSKNIDMDIAPKVIEDNIDLINMHDNNIKKKKKALSDFCNNKFNEIIGNYYISGYDPYNMIKVGDYILCNNFISLNHKITKKNLFLKGPVVVKLAPNTVDEVISYYA